jgi:hypothetical protein
MLELGDSTPMDRGTWHVSVLQTANLGLRFLLELCALAALGCWGFQTGHGAIGKIGLGIGGPLLAAVVWGALVAPNAPVAVPEPWHLLLEVAVFGAAAGLTASGHPALAWAFALIAALNRALMAVWEQ